MPIMHPCDNKESGCENFVFKPGLCPDCKEAARKLDRRVQSDVQLERTLRDLEQKPRRPSDVWGK